MLILTKEQIAQKLHDERKGLESHFNQQLEKILNDNSSKELYWILGRVKFPEEFEGKVGKTFLEATDTKPPLVKNAFLYEVDNKRGVKTLLWVMHPDGTLRLPTLNKTIKPNVSKQQGVTV